jgi:ATP-binding cassette, subfamily C, bacterial CydD
MVASSETPEAAARQLLQREARTMRGLVLAPVELGLLSIGCGIAQAWLLARLLATLLGQGEAGWRELAIAALLALVMAGLSLAQERAQLAAGAVARARLRRQVFTRLLETGTEDARAVGERAALAVDRVEALDGYFARWLPAAALALLGPLMVAAAAAWADWRGGLILLVAGLLVPVAQALTGIGAAQASRRQFDALQRLSGRFLDRMRGLPIIVLFNRQEAEAEALGAAAEELRHRTMRVLRVAFLSSAALELFSAAALGLLAWHRPGSGAEALFALLLVPAFFAPLRAFSAAYHEAMSARGAAAALAPLLALPEPQGLMLEEVPPRVVLTATDLTLSYDPARPPALDGVSFRVNAGEALVLWGPSGSGKTSLLRLLMGFRAPDAGRLAINGRDITGLRPGELRRLSAYVGQRAHLFRATLRENIHFARPEASEAEVEAAARAARVTDFAEALPQGLDTLMGEGGWGLSGGQAQRVALARAFLRDAPLVLLDEPTAHLDPATEAEVLESLKRLCIGRTAVIASHSPTLRAQFPRVLELDHGRVANFARAMGD